MVAYVYLQIFLATTWFLINQVHAGICQCPREIGKTIPGPLNLLLNNDFLLIDEPFECDTKIEYLEYFRTQAVREFYLVVLTETATDMYRVENIIEIPVGVEGFNREDIFVNVNTTNVIGFMFSSTATTNHLVTEDKGQPGTVLEPSSTFYQTVKRKAGIFFEATSVNDIIDLTGATTEEYFFSARFVLSIFDDVGDSCTRNTFIRSNSDFQPSIESGLNSCALEYHKLAEIYNHFSHYFRRDDVAFENLAKEFQEGVYSERMLAFYLKEYINNRSACVLFEEIPAPDTAEWTQVEALESALNGTKEINTCLQNVYDNPDVDSASRDVIQRLATERYLTINRLAFYITTAKKMQVTQFKEWVFDVLKVHNDPDSSLGHYGGQYFQDLFPSKRRDIFLGLRRTLKLD